MARQRDALRKRRARIKERARDLLHGERVLREDRTAVIVGLEPGVKLLHRAMVERCAGEEDDKAVELPPFFQPVDAFPKRDEVQTLVSFRCCSCARQRSASFSYFVSV